MFKSGILLSGGNILTAALGLVRNIVIARLLSVEDFGIASTFAVTMAIIEMTSNVALDRLIVQAKAGDDQKFQATLHSIQVVRGLLGSAILFLIAHPIASLFGIQDIAWAYQVLAIVPLLRGLAHLDMFRMQREMQFLPFISVELISQILATIAAFLFAIKLNDYRAMLFALIIQQLTFLFMSHMVAKNRYSLGWNTKIAQQAFQFGWPLLLNGLIMFGVFQGDRIIVGNVVGIVELGWYSAAFTLTLVPTLVIAKTLNAFFLPQLSNLRSVEAAFQDTSCVTIQAAIFCGVGLSLFFFAIGNVFFLALFGAKYSPALEVLLLLSVMQAIRISKAGPAIVALATAHTNIPLISNCIRALAFPVAWYAITITGDINSIIYIAIISEIFGLLISLYLLNSKLELRLKPLRICLLISLILLFSLILLDYSKNLYYFEIKMRLLFSFLAVFVVLIFMPQLKYWMIKQYRSRKILIK